MSKDTGISGKRRVSRPNIVMLLGAIFTILLIIATEIISRRNLNEFVSAQVKYILSAEVAILSILIVEMLVRLVTLRWRTRRMVQLSAHLSIAVRIVGYILASVSIISMLSSNATLGISVGTIAGIVIAFATQNTLGSVLATIVIIGTRMVRIGEEITIDPIKGIVSDITLTHLVVSLDDDIAFIPNSLLLSSIIRRKKRIDDKDANVKEW